jgi:hypothetical protein
LQDGTVLKGTACGAAADAVFELVFNTSMSGYQEIMTDLPIAVRSVLFTATHYGNVGINMEDDESLRPQFPPWSPVRSVRWFPTGAHRYQLSQWLEMYQVPGNQRLGYALAGAQNCAMVARRKLPSPPRALRRTSCCSAAGIGLAWTGWIWWRGKLR